MNRAALKALAEQQKQEEAKGIQFILGEICYKIEQVTAEIKRWKSVEANGSWVELHIQNKKSYLYQLIRQKIMFTEGLTTFIESGIILEPYEIVKNSEKLCKAKEIEFIENLIEILLREN